MSGCTGAVARSSNVSRISASWSLHPHISGEGRKLEQTAGRSGRPNSAQRLSEVSWTQRTPAGLPRGMPGIGEEIDGAIQQAPHPTRHSIQHLLVNRKSASGAMKPRPLQCFVLVADFAVE